MTHMTSNDTYDIKIWHTSIWPILVSKETYGHPQSHLLIQIWLNKKIQKRKMGIWQLSLCLTHQTIETHSQTIEKHRHHYPIVKHASGLIIYNEFTKLPTSCNPSRKFRKCECNKAKPIFILRKKS